MNFTKKVFYPMQTAVFKELLKESGKTPALPSNRTTEFEGWGGCTKVINEMENGDYSNLDEKMAKMSFEM